MHRSTHRSMLPAVKLFVLLALTVAPYAYPRDLDLDASMPGATLPFDLRSDFLVVVNGQVGELTGLKFIVDTGSSYTVLDQKVAEKLRLPRRPGKITNFDRNIPVEWVDIRDLRAGPIRAAALSVMVVNLAEYSALAGNVDGIIGLDLLSKGRKLIIDYERRVLSFDLDKNEVGENEASEHPPSLYFAVPVVVQGLRMLLFVDTGSRDMLLYKDRLHKGLPNVRVVGEPEEGAIGRLRATQVNLPGVNILGVDMAGPERVATVFLIDGPEHGDPFGVDGYLGPASLHAKRIEFDFAASKLRWQ
ncbi:MAG: retropepsin-like aspartic protease [Candidatus Sulfotelmatobacter sp.]